MVYWLEFTDKDISEIKKWMYVHLEHGSVAEPLYKKLVLPEKHDHYPKERNKVEICSARDSGKTYEMLRKLVDENPRSDISIVNLTRCPMCGEEKGDVNVFGFRCRTFDL